MGKFVAFCVAFGDVVGFGEVLLRRFVAACISLGDMVGVGSGLFGMLVGFVSVCRTVG